VFVGLRYNAPDLGRPSGGDYRRRSGKWASLTLAAPPALDMPRVVHVMSEWRDQATLLPGVLLRQDSSRMPVAV